MFCPAYDVCVADAESGPGAQADRMAGLDTSVAHPARVYDYWLLRHEALCYRAGVRDLRRRAVAAV